jgi:hypothetical protein
MMVVVMVKFYLMHCLIKTQLAQVKSFFLIFFIKVLFVIDTTLIYDNNVNINEFLLGAWSTDNLSDLSKI